MGKHPRDKPDYGNWVSLKLIYIPGAIALLFFGISIVLPGFLVGALLFFLPSIYFAYARYRFSFSGGDLQSQIQELVLDHLVLGWEGKILDIGCGNGPLTITMAKKYPNAQITGIDYWSGAWEYSKAICERNAEIEGVAKRITFQKASASSLPFEDEFFDAVVSNLVFHEVSDAKEKRNVIKEALRVVKKEGTFAFQDLFLWKRVYGELDDLIETIRSWGIEGVEFVNTSDSLFIPKALKLPFMVGTIGILYGQK